MSKEGLEVLLNSTQSGSKLCGTVYRAWLILSLGCCMTEGAEVVQCRACSSPAGA